MPPISREQDLSAPIRHTFTAWLSHLKSAVYWLLLATALGACGETESVQLTPAPPAVEPGVPLPAAPILLLEKDLAPGVSIEVRAPAGSATKRGSPASARKVKAELVKGRSEAEALERLGTNPLGGILELTDQQGGGDFPVEVELTWPEGSLTEAQAEALAVCTLDERSGMWIPAMTRQLDVKSRRIVAQLEHFSPYALVAPNRVVSELAIRDFPLVAGGTARIDLEMKFTGDGRGSGYLEMALFNPDDRANRLVTCELTSEEELLFSCQLLSAGYYDLVVSKLPGEPSTDKKRGGIALWEQRVLVGGDGTPLEEQPAWVERAKRYAPILKYDPKERYLPLAVEDLFGDDTEIRVWVPFNGLPKISGRRAIVDFLATHGHLGATIDGQTSGDLAKRTLGQMRASPVIYWQAVEDGNRAVITYWMLYPYDPKSDDLSWGAHTLDRESLSVVFSKMGNEWTPQEVVYAGHLPGQGLYRVKSEDRTVLNAWNEGAVRVPWDRVIRRCDRPVAFVAQGAHALYPRAGMYAIFGLDGHPLKPEGTALPDSWFTKFVPWAGGEPASGNGAVLHLKGTTVESDKGLQYELRSFPRPNKLTSDVTSAERMFLFSGYWVDVLVVENARFPPFVERFMDPIKWWRDLPDPSTATFFACPYKGCGRCASAFPWLTTVGNQWKYIVNDVLESTVTVEKVKSRSGFLAVQLKTEIRADSSIQYQGSNRKTFRAVDSSSVRSLDSLDDQPGEVLLATSAAGTLAGVSKSAAVMCSSEAWSGWSPSIETKVMEKTVKVPAGEFKALCVSMCGGCLVDCYAAGIGLVSSETSCLGAESEYLVEYGLKGGTKRYPENKSATTEPIRSGTGLEWPEYDRALRKSIELMKEFASILESLKDLDKVEAARPKLKDNIERLKDHANDIKRLGEPDMAIREQLKNKYGHEIEKSVKRIKATLDELKQRENDDSEWEMQIRKSMEGIFPNTVQNSQ